MFLTVVSKTQLMTIQRMILRRLIRRILGVLKRSKYVKLSLEGRELYFPPVLMG